MGAAIRQILLQRRRQGRITAFDAHHDALAVADGEEEAVSEAFIDRPSGIDPRIPGFGQCCAQVSAGRKLAALNHAAELVADNQPGGVPQRRERIRR